MIRPCTYWCFESLELWIFYAQANPSYRIELFVTLSLYVFVTVIGLYFRYMQSFEVNLIQQLGLYRLSSFYTVLYVLTFFYI